MIKCLARFFSYLMIKEDEHPYSFSFVLSVLIVAYIIFHTPKINLSNTNLDTTEDEIHFIDIERMSAPKRIVKKQMSTTATDASVSTERAIGTSDEANAVDISFFPNIASPKPVGRLKKIYPEAARKEEVEAVVTTEILINASGKVVNVRIIGIRLSKAVTTEMSAILNKDFARDAMRILLGAQFTSPIVNGEKVPIKMELPLKFKLDDLL